MTSAPYRTDLAHALATWPLRESPYFRALEDESFDREDFVETQVQFYYAVVFFARPMAVLAARIPSPALRLEVLRNVWEEHGEGRARGFHGNTFVEFLRRLDAMDVERIHQHVVWPETRSFNTALGGCALLDDWEVGTACFAIIERMFVDASHWIAAGIVRQGWMSKDDIVHYATHETLDVKHADDFLRTLAAGTDDSARTRYLVRQGLSLGAYLFRRLYDDLFGARARRDRDEGTAHQPHIYRADPSG